jgi:hypothetical protein
VESVESADLFFTLAGTPTATALSGISLLTKLKAPTTEFSPTVTPGMMTLWLPILQFFFNVTVPVLLSMLETE